MYNFISFIKCFIKVIILLFHFAQKSIPKFIFVDSPKLFRLYYVICIKKTLPVKPKEFLC
ncbi:MAG: hypothetical protein RHS_1749 [Robinsoniella sp. RHS]|nr:MAG: hypothetical protein RHS_1749 [Robinsoniella sp. RHS]